MAIDRLIKPRFFELVGWTWFLTGISGLVFSMIGILTLPALGTAQETLSGYVSRSIPELNAVFKPLFDWFVPLLIIKTIYLGAMTYISWMFLKRKPWSLLGVKILNYVTIGSILWGYVWFVHFIQKVMHSLAEGGYLQAIDTPISIPTLADPRMLILLLLSLSPFILMAFYFRWEPVEQYFNAPLA